MYSKGGTIIGVPSTMTQVSILHLPFSPFFHILLATPPTRVGMLLCTSKVAQRKLMRTAVQAASLPSHAGLKWIVTLLDAGFPLSSPLLPPSIMARNYIAPRHYCAQLNEVEMKLKCASSKGLRREGAMPDNSSKKQKVGCVSEGGEVSTLSFSPSFAVSSSKVWEMMVEIYDSTPFMCVEDAREEYPSPASVEEAGLAGLRTGQLSLFLIAMVGNECAGFVKISQRKPSKLRHGAELSMGVHPKFQGRGVGKALMVAARHVFESEQGIKLVYLMVREENISAIRLYQTFGFEKMVTLDRDTFYDGAYFNGIMMRWVASTVTTRLLPKLI